MATSTTEAEVKLALTAEAEFETYPVTKGVSMFGVATLQAPLYQAKDRAPVDLVAVIDRSGSMGGQKIELVMDTMLFVISQLSSNDRLAVVIYDDVIEVLFDFKKMNESGREYATSQLKTVHARNSTNLADALFKGMKLSLDRKADKNRVGSVLLLTDGQANIGMCAKSEIEAAMAQMLVDGKLPTPAAREGQANRIHMSRARMQMQQQSAFSSNVMPPSPIDLTNANASPLAAQPQQDEDEKQRRPSLVRRLSVQAKKLLGFGSEKSEEGPSSTSPKTSPKASPKASPKNSPRKGELPSITVYT
eukprot:Colp12_sorted_trinity150504_noHs@29130